MPALYIHELYAKVSKARESCAGSKVADLPVVLRNIQDALNYAVANQAEQSVIMKLNQALSQVKNASVWEDRLPADDLLCDIMNHDLTV
jgi:hypothetical protein